MLLSSIFLFSVVNISSSTSSSSFRISDEEFRSRLTPSNAVKDFIFYHSTFPIPGLDPAIFRRDLNGQLIMAGMRGCQGCLCYSLDHRLPISYITNKSDILARPQLAKLLRHEDNLQMISYRANILKSNNPEERIAKVFSMFGCDEETMRLFTENGFEGAKMIASLYYSPHALAQHHADYEKYLRDAAYYERLSRFPISEEAKLADAKAVADELDKRAQEIKIDVDAILYPQKL